MNYLRQSIGGQKIFSERFFKRIAKPNGESTSQTYPCLVTNLCWNDKTQVVVTPAFKETGRRWYGL